MTIAALAQKREIPTGFSPKVMETFFATTRLFFADYQALREIINALQKRESVKALSSIKAMRNGRGAAPLPPWFSRLEQLVYKSLA